MPVDSAAAQQISAPNYDEFQGDQEVWDLLQQKPQCVLRVTMAHCDTPEFSERLKDGSTSALDVAARNMVDLVNSPLTRTVEGALWVYEIVSPRRPDVRQLGVGGLARTDEIRTDTTPRGCIIRNEGIRQEKADGRTRLIEKTNAYIGTVNLAVSDSAKQLTAFMTSIADREDPDFECADEAGNQHRVWLVVSPAEIQKLRQLLSDEPAAYVADGNHRSAAAASLGKDHFLAVFFPTELMRLEPYNRLVVSSGLETDEFLARLRNSFTVEPLGVRDSYRPDRIHDIGLYTAGAWCRLTPLSGTYDPQSAVQSIDSDIVQRHIFEAILGIADARDERLNFVGGNKDSAWLKRRVDAGDYEYAISMAPVTMEQFVAVCEQNQFMPPKSTWFDPKIRSGLVSALLDPPPSGA